MPILNISRALEAVYLIEKKLKKPAFKWIEESEMPRLYWKENGEEVPDSVTRFMFYTQKQAKSMPLQGDVIGVLKLIDKTKSGDFGFELMRRLGQNGGLYAKNKAVFGILGVLADDRIIDTVKTICTKKNNANAPFIIGHIGTMKAARALEDIRIHFKTKYPNVKKVATESFNALARSMQLTPAALMDEMIPNFGFDNLFRSFEVGTAKFRAYIGTDFKLKYLDENDKVRKSIPAKTEATIKDEFKAIQKEIRTIVKQQKVSLENYLVSQRQWDVAAWKKHFLGKPLMFAFAQGIIWGVYKDGALENTFAVSQDQTLEDADYEEVNLEEGTKIGAIHPLGVDADDLAAWQEYMNDNEMIPTIAQLDRPVILATEERKAKKIIRDFAGRTFTGTTYLGRAEKRGWRRGSVVDGGGISGFFKSFENAKIDVFMLSQGMYVGMDWSEQGETQNVFFVKSGTVRTGSYTYDEPSKETDPRLIQVKDVPKVIYSEVMADIEEFLR